MDAWSIILLLVTFLIYIGAVAIYYLIRFIWWRIKGVNIVISFSKLAILLSILLFSFAGFFLVFNNTPNTTDFLTMSFYLLMGGILAMFGNYMRIGHQEKSATRQRIHTCMRRKDRISAKGISYESVTEIERKKAHEDKIDINALKQECIESLNRYFETKKRKYLAQAHAIIEILEEKEAQGYRTKEA